MLGCECKGYVTNSQKVGRGCTNERKSTAMNALRLTNSFHQVSFPCTVKPVTHKDPNNKSQTSLALHIHFRYCPAANYLF